MSQPDHIVRIPLPDQDGLEECLEIIAGSGAVFGDSTQLRRVDMRCSEAHARKRRLKNNN